MIMGNNDRHSEEAGERLSEPIRREKVAMSHLIAVSQHEQWQANEIGRKEAPRRQGNHRYAQLFSPFVKQTLPRAVHHSKMHFESGPIMGGEPGQKCRLCPSQFEAVDQVKHSNASRPGGGAEAVFALADIGRFPFFHFRTSEC